MSSGAGSLESAIEAAAGAPIRTSMLPDPEQLELMRGKDGALPAAAIHQVRGRGRPKGALNKRQKKIADYFVQKYGDPLDVLGQIKITPLKQLVDVLKEADGSADREDRLLEFVGEAMAFLKDARGTVTDEEKLTKVGVLVDRLADMAGELRSKPGKLALDTLIVQLSAVKLALEYVHGKQPVSIEVAGKVDMVVFAGEILRNNDISEADFAEAIRTRGLEAFDRETLQLLPPVDGEYEEVEGDG